MARMLLQRGVVDTLIYPLGGLKPCMDAMRTLRKRQTRGEAIIRRRTEPFKSEVKAGVLQFDTNFFCLALVADKTGGLLLCL